MINKRKVLRSIISYIPLLRNKLSKKGTGGSDSGQYCYNMWNIHKENAKKGGLNNFQVVAEIGPGDSIGSGLCALIDGSNKYIAMDAIYHAELDKNLKVYYELKNIYEANGHIISMSTENKILNELSTSNNERINIKYYAPWWKYDVIEDNKVDFIFSTAVLEHIDDLQSFYNNAYKILRSGGVISSIIDYGAHEFSDNWFDHLYYRKNFWEFLMHGRKYRINRLPHSFHILLMEKAGFKIIFQDRKFATKAAKNRIDKDIQLLFDENDLSTKSGVIIGKKN